jgi:cell division protein FtsB
MKIQSIAKFKAQIDNLEKENQKLKALLKDLKDNSTNDKQSRNKNKKSEVIVVAKGKRKAITE